MPIYRLLQNSALDPEHINLMTSAFEDICRELGLAAREDALRDIVAKTIIECAQRGISTPLELRQCARDALKSA
jgi:hypothetical protein